MSAATAFAEIVASFSKQLGCEMPTHTSGQCQRLARWRIDLHGCEQVNMCSHHKAAWVRREQARALQSENGLPRCAHCGHAFPSFNDAVRITAI
ncbi:hypothetical protein [Mycobacterium gordonae]|uniref:hypothetical protein n=1 Tax=Mycobacterium gordonae TaxID=1778 RepID=UPI0011500BD3|nr:hypothetical protein [Mycobacterium gordonae]MCV7005650.1 hypothetical protein [Mycobacterium gordonae]